jgi:hypothetical protein
MPRTLQQIVEDQDRIAALLEAYEPDPADERDPSVFRALLEASNERARAETALAEAVSRARDEGFSWSLIGSAIGTSGQAAQQRYGPSRRRGA